MQGPSQGQVPVIAVFPHTGTLSDTPFFQSVTNEPLCSSWVGMWGSRNQNAPALTWGSGSLSPQDAGSASRKPWGTCHPSLRLLTPDPCRPVTRQRRQGLSPLGPQLLRLLADGKWVLFLAPRVPCHRADARKGLCMHEAACLWQAWAGLRLCPSQARGVPVGSTPHRTAMQVRNRGCDRRRHRPGTGDFLSAQGGAAKPCFPGPQGHGALEETEKQPLFSKAWMEDPGPNARVILGP